MLLLAAAAMMALGISAEETTKTSQQTTATTQTEIRQPAAKQGQMDISKFRRADDKKTSQQVKKLPSDVRVVKEAKKAPKK